MEFWKSRYDKTKWHVWFAWHPVCIESDEHRSVWVWLTNVQRCQKWDWWECYYIYKKIKGV